METERGQTFFALEAETKVEHALVADTATMTRSTCHRGHCGVDEQRTVVDVVVVRVEHAEGSRKWSEHCECMPY